MKNNFGIVLHESRCTNNCVFCGGKKIGNIKKNIAQELAKIDQVIKDGQVIERIEISGQDPGEYDKLPEFVAKIKSRAGVKEISLFTNGKKLADKKFLKKVVASGVDHFILPLYGHSAKIHDKVTGSIVSFALTSRGIANLYELKQKVSFQCLITKENQAYLKELVLFLAKLPFAEFCRLGVPCYKKNNKKFIKSIPDFTLLKNQLSDALLVCQQRNFNLQLFDMPRCLVNFYYRNMVANSIPDKAYENLKKNKFHSFKILRNQAVPEYRLKKKCVNCKKCVCFKTCSGFFANYIDFNYFKCQPILEKRT